MAKTAGTTRQQIEAAIRKNEFAAIYLLMGEEAFYIDRIAELIIQNALTESEKDFNLATFYGADSSMSDVILACRRYPMMADRQVVILKEAQSAKAGKQMNWDLLRQYALNPTPTTILIVCYKGGTIKSTGLTKAINQSMLEGKQAGVVFESSLLREYNIDKALMEYVASTGFRIESKALAMLIDYVGCDMAMLAKEVDKLEMSQLDKMITADAVEQNVGISKEYNTFELVNAIANKDKVKVFKIIEYFRANPKKGPGVLAASTLFTFFSNLLIAFYARTTDERALMEALRLKSPFQLKDYRIGMKRYTATQSMKAIVALREFDTRSKGIGSNRNEYDLLEELILKIFDA